MSRITAWLLVIGGFFAMTLAGGPFGMLVYLLCIAGVVVYRLVVDSRTRKQPRPVYSQPKPAQRRAPTLGA